MAIALADYSYIADFVRLRSGLILGSDRAYLVETRLEPLLLELGAASLADLVGILRGEVEGPLHRRVVEAMTTNETMFFRDVYPFEALKSDVLPALIARRRTTRTLNIWSAVCSSGQEPYSVAMLLREHFPELADWNVNILATDISIPMLERARAGRYGQLEIGRGLPAQLLVKYFTRDGAAWVLDEGLRRAVDFQHLNLLSAWPPMPRMDVVLLRNVLIYFDVETKRRVLKQVREVLSPEARLFLGGCETTVQIDDAFEGIVSGKGMYYRVRGA